MIAVYLHPDALTKAQYRADRRQARGERRAAAKGLSTTRASVRTGT